jgi:hypothetical protein
MFPLILYPSAGRACAHPDTTAPGAPVVPARYLQTSPNKKQTNEKRARILYDSVPQTASTSAGTSDSAGQNAAQAGRAGAAPPQPMPAAPLKQDSAPRSVSSTAPRQAPPDAPPYTASPSRARRQRPGFFESEQTGGNCYSLDDRSSVFSRAGQADDPTGSGYNAGM